MVSNSEQARSNNVQTDLAQSNEIVSAELNLEDFAYQLPPELIARHPAEERDNSRLLYYNKQNKSVNHMQFSDIGTVLKAGDILVVNNTKVIPAKLIGHRQSGGGVELLLIKQEPGEPGLWQAMAMPMRKLKAGDVITIQGKENRHNIFVKDIVIAADGQKRVLIKLGSADKGDQTFTILQDAGAAPLPPYIVNARQIDSGAEKIDSKDNQAVFDKDEDIEDLERYQTVFAKKPGAVAAPTAGLHFSPALLAALEKQGITICEITLHVGPGTFKPITTSIEEHVVEAEWFSIPEKVCQAINAGKKAGQRIIAVGTTSCRALESAYINGGLVAKESYTPLFIKPGYTFKVIDGLVTNFHLSKSSLLLLVAAFMGKDELLKTYRCAIEERYRFYSYGDAMLIL